MKFTNKNWSVSIGDDDERVRKIQKGFDWFINEIGELVVTDNKIHLDKDDLESKLSQGKATDKEIQEVLLHLLKKSQS